MSGEEVDAQGEQDDALGVVVPLERLTADVLAAVIEEFVSREGTDYGHIEPDMDAKREQVRRQLESGEAFVLFDPKTESVNIVSAEELERAKQSAQ